MVLDQSTSPLVSAEGLAVVVHLATDTSERGIVMDSSDMVTTSPRAGENLVTVGTRIFAFNLGRVSSTTGLTGLKITRF